MVNKQKFAVWGMNLYRTTASSDFDGGCQMKGNNRICNRPWYLLS